MIRPDKKDFKIETPYYGAANAKKVIDYQMYSNNLENYCDELELILQEAFSKLEELDYIRYHTQINNKFHDPRKVINARKKEDWGTELLYELYKKSIYSAKNY